MPFQILPSTVRLERAPLLRTSIRPKRLMRALVLAQITAVRAGKVAEPALVRLLPLMEGGDVCLELGVRCRSVSAAVADVRALASVGALVVVFGLVGREGFGAGGEAAGVRTVAGVA